MAGRRGRPTVQIVLSEEERETLQRWARRPKSAQVLALRCRIVLGAADGKANKIPVKYGFNDGTNVEITGGLPDNARIILPGKTPLVSGQPVTVVEAK